MELNQKKFSENLFPNIRMLNKRIPGWDKMDANTARKAIARMQAEDHMKDDTDPAKFNHSLQPVPKKRILGRIADKLGLEHKTLIQGDGPLDEMNHNVIQSLMFSDHSTMILIAVLFGVFYYKIK